MIRTTKLSTETSVINHEAIAAYMALTKLRDDIGNVYATTDFLDTAEYERLVEIADKACMRTVDAMSFEEYTMAKAMLSVVHKQY